MPSQPRGTSETQKSSTQQSSVISHDPALDIPKKKSAYLDDAYQNRGLYKLYTEAYPGFKADEQQFNNILEFQVWKVKDDLKPRIKAISRGPRVFSSR